MFPLHLRGACLLMVICCLGPRLFAQGNEDAEARYAAAGQHAMAEGQYTTARDNFEKLARLEPNIAEVHATLGVIDFKLRAFDDAVREIETARRLKPSLPKLDSLLGLSLAELGRFADALPGLEKGFRVTGDPEVRRMCGLQLLRAYTSLHRDADAVQVALALDKSFPDDPEILYNTGRIYANYAYLTMLRLHDKAEGSVWTLQASGEAHESERQYDAAIADFQAVLTRDPQRVGIHYRLGRIYLARFTAERKPADREAAAREYAAELAGDPANGNAAYELATLHADAGELDEAAAGYAAVVARYPDFEEALVGLGGVEARQGHPDLALGPLERATKLRPDDEVAWYRLAQAERALGNKDAQGRALAAFTKLHQAGGTVKAPDEVTPQRVDNGEKP